MATSHRASTPGGSDADRRPKGCVPGGTAPHENVTEIDARESSAREPDPHTVNPYRDVPGHPQARGTLPMARLLVDLAIEDEIQALAAEAGPMSEDQRATLSRLLRLNRHLPRAA